MAVGGAGWGNRRRVRLTLRQPHDTRNGRLSPRVATSGVVLRSDRLGRFQVDLPGADLCLVTALARDRHGHTRRVFAVKPGPPEMPLCSPPTAALAPYEGFRVVDGREVRRIRPHRMNERKLPAPVPCPSCWHPPLAIDWQWQLSGSLDLSVPAAMYDVDMFETSANQVSRLHALGRKAVCYIDAGSWEKWRPDAKKFPASVLGKPLQGWPGERWLDIRRLKVLEPLMIHRVKLCQAKGFDGVEFDNVDGYENNTGFGLTAGDQLSYDVFLANLAHENGLAVALKNDVEQVKPLLPYFDWSLDEQCFQYDECAKLTPFVKAGKPVMEVEYSLSTTSFCPKAASLSFNSMRKHLNLGPWRQVCRAG